MKKINILILIFALTLLFTGCFVDTEENANQNTNTSSFNTAQWKGILNLPTTECAADEEEPIQEYKLNDQESILLVLCFRLAYQDSYALYHYNYLLDTAQPLVLKNPETSQTENIFASVESYPDFSTSGNKLKVVYKAAGHFGCGYAADYIWDEVSKEYQLESAVGHFNCEAPLDYDQWPEL